MKLFNILVVRTNQKSPKMHTIYLKHSYRHQPQTVVQAFRIDFEKLNNEQINKSTGKSLLKVKQKVKNTVREGSLISNYRPKSSGLHFGGILMH